MEGQNRIRVVIIEDNPAIRREIRNIVEQQSGNVVEVVGEAESVVTGAKLVQQENPDLLLLDIELPDGTGFDILDLVGTGPRVIFITASEEYALRAFKFAAIDYLVKPVDPREMKAAIERALTYTPTQKRQVGMAADLYSGRSSSQTLALHTSDKIRYAAFEDIVRCEADGNYSKFVFSDGTGMLVARTLKEYDRLLGPEGFLRVHQSHLVNPAFIREFIKTDGGYIVLVDGTKIPVSTRKRAYVLERLEGGSPDVN